MQHTRPSIAIATVAAGPRRMLRAVAAVLIAAGSVFLALATSASAATLDGTATIATPGSLAPLASGGSTTQFSVTLPANAACSGDTASDGYHVYSYLVEKGTALSSVTFINSPSTGYGFVDNTGLYYGPINTAIKTGQIVGIPNDFEWAPLVTVAKVPLSDLLYTGGTTGVWEAGLACADTTGKLSDNWNTEITFTASSGDPNGFTWSAVPGVTTPTTTTTSTTTSTTSSTATTATTDQTPSDSTTTTAAAGGAVAASSTGGGSSSSSGSSGAADAGTGTSGTTAGSLAFTGFPVWKGVGIGLLAIGVGLMLLGWGYESRKRAAGALPRSPW